MTATLLDGEALARQMRLATADRVRHLRAVGITPHLVAVQLGDPPASRIYVRKQAHSCREVGIDYDLLQLPPETSQNTLIGEIHRLNQAVEVTGIIVQLPLPAHIDPRAVQNALSPVKDVEGIHTANYGRLFGGTGHVAPCTAMAAVELLRSTGQDLAGAEAIVVGHSEIVGKPIAMLLLQSPDRAPTVTVCHVATRDLKAHTRRADVLVVATGVRQSRWQRWKSQRVHREAPPDLAPLISAEMVKPGAIVVDVAINRIPESLDAAGEPARDAEGKPRMVTVGDVDFQAVRQVAGAITPVPGGVGPVTVQMLLRNTVACALQAQA